MATQSSTLAWKIPWTEDPTRGLQSTGVAKSQTRLSDFTSLHFSIKCLRLSRQVHQVAQGSATCLEVPTLRQGKVYLPTQEEIRAQWMESNSFQGFERSYHLS